MKRLAVAVLVAGCGADEARLEMSFSGLTVPIAEYQVAIITERANVDCSAVTTTCVKGAFPVGRFVSLQDSKGNGLQAVRVAADAGLSVQLSPVRDVAVVVEALTADSPPQLAGSSCTYVPNITAGSNRVSATLFLKVDGGVVSNCDPRI